MPKFSAEIFVPGQLHKYSFEAQDLSQAELLIANGLVRPFESKSDASPYATIREVTPTRL